MLPRWPASLFSVILLVLALFLPRPLRTVPAGHVGVKDFFGHASTQTLPVGSSVRPSRLIAPRSH
jgi:hypothetical protein